MAETCGGKKPGEDGHRGEKSDAEVLVVKTVEPTIEGVNAPCPNPLYGDYVE